MIIRKNISLKTYNTFGIDVNAKEFITLSSSEELLYLVDKGIFRDRKFLILGGGSNILFANDIDGLVIRNEIGGIALSGIGDEVIVKAGAGIVWNDLVWYCIERNLGGIENLSLIPGSVGAGPIQNIGAYGVELKDSFAGLEAVEVENGTTRSFNQEECRFAYRDSIFKNELKGKYVIISVSMALNKGAAPDISYGAIREELDAMGVKGDPGIRDVGLAVNAIRRKKLPDPEITGNAGSFFKNPVIPQGKYDALMGQFPEMPSYEAGPAMRKIPAGWLIERCGWKGRRVGNAGVHDRQALVLVNHGGATGTDILTLANDIRDSVGEKFGILLEMEVNVI
ncbi:MAG TPA: UDP-N-acetylmuramate dehydrogenase [Bacteroidales bacterium]|nr:UDP-N-acetylmuramate dehydrogenase [Bacteroidales bacterium]